MNRNRVTIRIMMCQPIAQNIDFSGSDQIQTPQYPDVHPPNEISDEAFHAKEDLMKSIQTFLEEFNCIPFEEKPQILLEACKDRLIFLNNNEEHSYQNKECLENSSNEIDASSSNQEKEEPPQDSNIHQLIEECSTEICEEQKQSMEDTMLELVKICRQKELLCIHDNVDDLIEIAPILSTKEPEYSSSMGYENSNTTLETNSDEIIKSGVEELVPILSENEVTLEDKRECDLLVCENSTISDDHSDIFFDSKDDDDISVYDDDFEDIEYVEASLPDPEIVSVEEDVDLKDISQIQDERLITVMKNDIPDDSSNDPLLEEADLFLASDNSIPPGIENVADDSEGDIYFLEELLIDNSILSHESSDSYFKDNPSIPRPPTEPPDAETDAGEEIPVVINDKDKFDEDYYFFMIDKVFSFLSAESEDTIFDPDFIESPIEIFFSKLSLRTTKFRDRVELTTRILPQ
nr:hypothetical protein [Tanacetum cinerariifolium]